MTYHERIELFPPCLVRLLARTHRSHQPESGGNIASRSMTKHARLSTFEVESISQQTDWRRVTIYDAQAFIVGCGFDFCDTDSNNRMDAYIRSKPNFEYLRKSPDWTGYYMPLLLKWRQSHTTLVTVKWRPMRDLLSRLPNK